MDRNDPFYFIEKQHSTKWALCRCRWLSTKLHPLNRMLFCSWMWPPNLYLMKMYRGLDPFRDIMSGAEFIQSLKTFRLKETDKLTKFIGNLYNRHIYLYRTFIYLHKLNIKVIPNSIFIKERLLEVLKLFT